MNTWVNPGFIRLAYSSGAIAGTKEQQADALRIFVITEQNKNGIFTKEEFKEITGFDF